MSSSRSIVVSVVAMMANHIIVCGFGRVGEQVVRELVKNGTPVVVIERNTDWLEEMDDPLPYVEGDATEDDVLIAAGIERAAGLIAALPSDANNVFIALTAKGINRDIQVVARAERPESEEKLRRAGADKVINPSFLSGRRMAMTILKPVTVDYVDTIFHDRTGQYAIEEVKIEPHSSFVHTSVGDQAVRTRFRVTIIAIQRQDDIIGNPTPDERFCAGDIVIVFGEKRASEAFEQAVNKK